MRRIQITFGILASGLMACGTPEPSKPADDALLHEVRITDTGIDTGVPSTETGSPPIETGEPPEPVVDLDGDGYSPADGDCDDEDEDINPGAVELCDGVDNDCDEGVDNSALDGNWWYSDNDHDGYGDEASSVWSCEAPDKTTLVPGDCDDSDPTVHPGSAEWCDEVDNDCNGRIDELGAVGGSPWYRDSDRDGFGDTEDVVHSCNSLLGYAEIDGDCDDSDSTIHPDGIEACNGKDDDCSGTIDDGFELEIYFRDADGDLRGDALRPIVSCAPPSGYVSNRRDCDDTDTTVHSDMPELCDDKDNDCNGLVDDDVTTYWFYRDTDGDEVGDDSDAMESCDRPSGYVIDSGDCDDSDSTVYPGAWEACNGIDDDCSGVIDDGLTFSTYYADTDNDGFGDLESTVEACAVPPGYSADSTDCDDTRDWVNPAIEADCSDGVDEDCDGEIDEGPDRTWYEDADEDGFGSPTSTVTTCLMPSGYTGDSTDCDDTDPSFNPEAREVCDDGRDSDCDGLLDDDDEDCDCPDHGIELDEDIGLVTGTEVVTGSTSGFGDDIDGSCGSSGGQDYVMFWEAPAAGCYNITTNGSDFDTLLLIYHGCEGTEIACNDDGGEGLRSSLTLSSVEEGDVYFFVVDGYSSSSVGSFVLNINDCR